MSMRVSKSNELSFSMISYISTIMIFLRIKSERYFDNLVILENKYDLKEKSSPIDYRN